MYVCMNICACAHICTYVRTYMYIILCMYVCMYVRMYVILCVCVCVYNSVHVCMHANTTCIFLVSPISFMSASLDSFVTPDGVTFQSCPFLSGQSEADLPLVFSPPEVRGRVPNKIYLRLKLVVFIFSFFFYFTFLLYVFFIVGEDLSL